MGTSALLVPMNRREKAFCFGPEGRNEKRETRKRGRLVSTPPFELLAEVQGRDRLPITVEARLLEVIEEPAPLGDQLEETTTRVVVLRVGLEVLGEVGDALGEEGNLDFGRARIGLMRAEFSDEFRFLFDVKRHFLSLSDEGRPTVEGQPFGAAFCRAILLVVMPGGGARRAQYRRRIFRVNKPL
jgi:hypothetical protein